MRFSKAERLLYEHSTEAEEQSLAKDKLQNGSLVVYIHDNNRGFLQIVDTLKQWEKALPQVSGFDWEGT